jgi:hypothetical protein
MFDEFFPPFGQQTEPVKDEKEECPICYELTDPAQHVACNHCQKTICASCNLSIKQTRPSCPFCRKSWRSKEHIEEWRRRIQRTQRLAQWVQLTSTAVAPDHPYQNIAALAQVLLMGILAWTST